MHESLDFVTVECSIHKSYRISFDKVASILFSCLMKDNVMFFFNLLCDIYITIAVVYSISTKHSITLN